MFHHKSFSLSMIWSKRIAKYQLCKGKCFLFPFAFIFFYPIPELKYFKGGFRWASKTLTGVCDDGNRLVISKTLFTIFVQSLKFFHSFQKGANADLCCTKKKRLPLHVACFSGFVNVIKFLAKKTSDVNLPDAQGAWLRLF